MPVESEQAPVAAQPLEQEQPAHRAATGCGPAHRRASPAPRPPHDEHELPDGRYLLAYRSAAHA